MMPITFAFDHLVYAVPHLEASTRALEERLGVRAAPGGSHPGRGTKNALVGMGPKSYLEIIGPDPAQAGPRWFLLDELKAPRLVTWAVADSQLEKRTAASGGLLGPIATGSRQRPDGQKLQWRFTDPSRLAFDGLVPFFIDWLEGAHPADALEPQLSLVRLRLSHPKPREVEEVLRRLGIGLEVERADVPLVQAVLTTPRGEVTL